MKMIRRSSLVLIIACSVLLCSCYSVKYLNPNEYSTAVETKKLIRLQWEEGSFDNICLNDAMLLDGNLTGRASYLTSLEEKIARKHLAYAYLDQYVPLPDTIPCQFSIPLSRIKTLTVYQYDRNSTTFLILGSAIAGLTLASVLLINGPEPDPEPEPPDPNEPPPSGSCPTIYTFDGGSYQREGEVFGGAILPWLERDDYLPLPHLNSSEGFYRLKMSNEAEEIQHNNLEELIIVDHPMGSQALIDRHGTCRAVSNPRPPESASSDIQEDILPLLISTEGHSFLGDTDPNSTQSKDVIYLSFDPPADVKTASLLIHAKNSDWMEYTILEFCNLFGNKFETWYKRQGKARQDPRRDFLLEQNIPISVFMERNGAWVYVDYFPSTGPSESRDMVMGLDLAGRASGPVKLKLEWGALFWEIDSVAMDFGAPLPLNIQTVKLTEARDERGRELTAQLNGDDRSYYDMPATSNHAILEFEVPSEAPGQQRSVFLHARGHYQVKTSNPGRPQVKYLKSIARPGSMGQFSRQIYLALSGLLTP